MGSGRDELEEKIILALKNAPGVERNGKGLRVVFHYNGIRCRESFAIPVTVKNIKYCHERLVAIKHLIAINQFDYVQFFPNSKRAAMFSKTAVPITLEKLWELFKRHTLMDVKSSTLSAYEDMFHVISGIIGKSKVVSQITDKDVLDYRYIIREGKSATTANVRLSILKRLLIYAEEYGYMTKKLSKHCIRFKERRRKPDPFTKSEIRRALNRCNDAFHKCYLIVAVYTGMRTGEICALCWEDVDLDSATITVRSTIRQDQHLHAPKTGNERIVNLLPPAVDALREMQSLTLMLASAEVRFYDTATNFVVIERRPVFNQLALRTPAHRVSEFMQVQTIGKWWRGHSRRIGLRYRSIYQTRHTYASWMLAVTGNLKFIAEQMGHTDLEMISKVYGAWMPDNSAKENSRIWQELSEKENTDSDPDNKVGITALNLP